MTFFRYPGGKGKLLPSILLRINRAFIETRSNSYCEPFFGGGAIGLEVLGNLEAMSRGPVKVILGDMDKGLACLWLSIITEPDELKKMVRELSPSTETFYQFKEDLLGGGGGDSVVETGFKKLVCHQLSFSGLGTRSGGPLGGKDQESKYKVDCRWSPDRICASVDRLNRLFVSRGVKTFLQCDFEESIRSAPNALLYLDPPYYQKGPDLYQHFFTDSEHERLADLLKTLRQPWVLSYDDCQEIRELYDWADIQTLAVGYSIAGATTKQELLISNHANSRAKDRPIYSEGVLCLA